MNLDLISLAVVLWFFPIDFETALYEEGIEEYNRRRLQSR